MPTPISTSRGAGLLTPRAKWVSPLTLVANEVWRRVYRHLYCMIHDPEAKYFLALCRSLLRTTTASYMRSDITCAMLQESSAGPLLQLIWSSVHCSLVNLISVLIPAISPTGRQFRAIVIYQCSINPVQATFQRIWTLSDTHN